ncbi:MAG: hypothetical protein JNL07_01730 [Rhodospirillales bacterium]|nr:hypothetical protein [Rhodospirillales bacterium]
MASRDAALAKDFSREVAAMKKQLAQLAATIEATAKEGGDKASNIVDRGRELLAYATSVVDDVAHSARDAVSDTAVAAYERSKDTAYAGARKLEDSVVERPLIAITVAAGLGALVALCLHRR